MITFLQLLFSAVLAAERQLAIFTLPDRASRHFSDLNAAVVWAMEQAQTKDVYFGVALAGKRFGQRNEATDAAAIVGLWADIDMVAPHRADKPLPKTLDEVKRLLARLPFPPSVIVFSGYGVHAYWLFKEPWIFAGEDERRRAARMARGWHGLVCKHAASFGWKLENLGELARVLRVPGTFNRKAAPPIEVCILESHDVRRYHPSDFEEFEQELPADVVTAGDLVFRPDAEPPQEKFAQLTAACPAFLLAWNRQRQDFKDQSQSAYDQSLADIAALNGWPDQEIANLIIAARRKHNDKPEKALRPDYMKGTISNARAVAKAGITKGVDLSTFMMKASVVPTLSSPKSLRQLIETHPNLRPVVIDGLLREGETMNIISAPKVGKSFLVTDLALSVATASSWLGMPCAQGQVLVIDNELHPETSAHRIPKVALARGIDIRAVADLIFVENLRGRLQDLVGLGPYLRQFKPGRFKIIILDAFYRFLPADANENDNGKMASLYNCIDAYAEHLKCSFVLIHHSSKGNQSAKDVTDVGAGAGAQSRATDTHLVLRRHEVDDAVVLDASVRSFAPIKPFCLRWAFPVYNPAPELDATQLRQEGKRRKSESKRAGTGEEKPEWTRGAFVASIFSDEPKSHARAEEDSREQGISGRQFKNWIDMAVEEGSLHRWDLGQRRVGYAKVPQPVQAPAAAPPPTATKKQQIEELLRAEPGVANEQVAKRCDASEKYVREIRRQMGGAEDAK